MKRLAFHTSVGLSTFLTGILVSVGCTAFLRSRLTDDIKPPQISEEVNVFVLSQPQADNEKRSPIQTVDFRNFSYPGFWQHQRFRLKDGGLETTSEQCVTHFALERVYYVDLNHDGKEEALVNITDHTACGSSGTNDYYYIYAMKNHRPTLLWRFSTGSEGNCGQKYFRVDKAELVLELFGDCRIGGIEFEGGGIEYGPTEYSRIRVGWDGIRFSQISAEVLPYRAR